MSTDSRRPGDDPDQEDKFLSSIYRDLPPEQPAPEMRERVMAGVKEVLREEEEEWWASTNVRPMRRPERLGDDDDEQDELAFLNEPADMCASELRPNITREALGEMEEPPQGKSWRWLLWVLLLLMLGLGIAYFGEDESTPEEEYPDGTEEPVTESGLAPDQIPAGTSDDDRNDPSSPEAGAEEPGR